MARSRSLFDDLDTAIATAASLADEPKPPSVSDAPLVSFEQAAADAEKLPASPPRVVTQPPAAPTLPPSQKRPASQRLIPSRLPSSSSSSPSPAAFSQPRVASAPPAALASTQPAVSVASVAAPTALAPDVMSSTPPVPILTPDVPEPPLIAIPPVAMPPAPTRVSSTTVVPPTAASPGAAPPVAAISDVPAAPPLAAEPPAAAPMAAGAAKLPDALPPANDEAGEGRKLPPKLPDLTGIASPVVRCERIVSWIADATGATDVFLADASGYPLAGAVDVDAKLAGTGLVTASVASLAASIPGNVSSLFELHVGEGPFFQLIGFQAGASVYVVGFTRGAPLTPRQSHAIRLACRHALGDTLKGGLWETE